MVGTVCWAGTEAETCVGTATSDDAKPIHDAKIFRHLLAVFTMSAYELSATRTSFR